MPDNPSGCLPAASGIGALRWQVNLCQRVQTASTSNTGVNEDLVVLAVVHAFIEATYPSTFYNSVQVDTPITHLIRMRWTDYLEQTNIIQRVTERPTNGSLRAEIFRVRRVKEIGGRKRFVELECEIERTGSPTSDDPNELESLFAEQPALPMRH